MDDIVKDFLIESRENLDRLDQELVSLESDPSSKELLGSIFRTIHTIKGSCGFLGFARLEKVAHAGENLLSKLRDGVLPMKAEITSALLAMVDAVRRMLSEIQATETDGQNDYTELLEQFNRLQAARSSRQLEDHTKPMPVVNAPAAREAEVESGSTVRIPDGQASTRAALPSDTSGMARSSPQLRDPGDGAAQARPSPSKIGSLLVERGCVQPEELSFALRKQQGGDRRRLGDILVACGACTQTDVDATQQILEERARHAAVETIRVGVDLLDLLMNLVGELVLARNQLLQLSTCSEDRAFQAVSQRVNVIVTAMQEQILKTRLQPISNLWNKFPRTVRDLALSCGKEVRLEMEGQETELDRTIIEAMRDPLTHLVRNALDHGIEMPEVRRKAGKDPVGRLRLRACQQGGKVTLEVSDDGAGLNLECLCSKAIERGVITARQARGMNEREIFNLIFLPGFSTAEKVTKVSGRGVGMDVVKTNVEKISGVIDIDSVAGKGTTVRVSIPLTLAIVPALIVTCENERFTIPQAGVVELVALDGTGTGSRIETVHGYPVYRRRGNLLPLIYLRRELKSDTTDSTVTSTTASIVVLQADARQFGLVVDDILNTQEIVVKPLGEHFKSLNLYSGATILGDGGLALILDVLGLAQRANVMAETQASASQASTAELGSKKSTAPQTFVLARSGSELQVAIPLSAVTRLEGVPARMLKCVGGREVMEYHGQVVPILRLSRILWSCEREERPLTPNDFIEVVLYTEQGHTVGLIVDCIVDIIEAQPEIDRLASRPGVMGSFVLDHEIVEMLDLPMLVRTAIPELAKEADAARAVG
jgi:two-component system chemotaxis sensor kinase CheA